MLSLYPADMFIRLTDLRILASVAFRAAREIDKRALQKYQDSQTRYSILGSIQFYMSTLHLACRPEIDRPSRG